MHALAQFRGIEGGRLALRDYARLLQALFVYHASVAAAACAQGLAHLSSSARRLELLRLDLAHVGTEDPAHRAEPESRSPAALHGFLYVAEGSMLGGRVIARQLDYLLGSGADGRRFFAGSDEDRQSWPRLLAALRQACRGPADLDDMIRGAEESFGLFERCVEARP